MENRLLYSVKCLVSNESNDESIESTSIVGLNVYLCICWGPCWEVGRFSQQLASPKPAAAYPALIASPIDSPTAASEAVSSTTFTVRAAPHRCRHATQTKTWVLLPAEPEG